MNLFHAQIPANTILTVLGVSFALGLYAFFVYRLVSHRAFYNRSFNISIAVMPFFISTIILCLQSNLVITLGTIGALAILRFRTAVKDPVDMLYLLWSVHIGITCGCQLYEVAIFTSIAATVALILFEVFPTQKRPYILIVSCSEDMADEVYGVLDKFAKNYRVKSRSYNSRGVNLCIELPVRGVSELEKELSQLDLNRFSILEYDAEDVL